MNPETIRQYLEYYRDLGIKTVYRREGRPEMRDPEKRDPEIGKPVTGTGVHEGHPSQPPVFEGRPSQPPVFSGHPGQPPVFAGQPSEPPVFAGRPGRPAVFAEAAPAAALAGIQAEIGEDCRRCKLHARRTRVVFGSGNPEAKLVFVGEGPGADEDAQGLPFVGRAGQLLTQMIDNTAKKEGIPIERKDVYICNVVKCRPPGNRTPEPDEMAVCGEFLFRQLEAIRPKAICALGATAAKALLDRDGVTRMRGNWFEWRGIPVMVTYHPSYLLRPYNQNAKREAWEDLKKVLHRVYD